MKFKSLLFFALLLLGISTKSNGQCNVSSTPASYTYYSYMSINAFSLATVPSNNPGSSGTGYSSFATPVRNLTIGSAYPYTATTGSGWYGLAFAIWIDLDGNNQYDANEMLVTLAPSYTSARSGNITIPNTATPGSNRRMRVRSMWCPYSSFTGGQACSAYLCYGYGETEDYFVNLISPCTAPTINSHPQNTSKCAGQSATFTAAASGTGTTYKWQVNTGAGFADISGGPYSGVNTATLTIVNTPASFDNYQYRCVATANCGTPANTNAATLTVIPSVAITSQPMADTICEGAPTSITISASGSGNTYKWEMGTLSGGFVDVPNQYPFQGTTTPTLIISPAMDTMDNVYFRCIVEGTCGRDTTEPILLDVLTPPYFTKEPTDDTVMKGEPADFYVVVAGEDFYYQWQASSDGGDTYSNISNSALYSYYNTHRLEVITSLAKEGWMFRCVIVSTNPNCGNFRDTSVPGKIIVKYAAGLNDVENKLQATLYPNPASGSELNIEIPKAGLKAIDVVITDKLGRTALKHNVQLKANSTGVVPISNLAPGVYTIQMLDADKNLLNTQKFTKE